MPFLKHCKNIVITIVVIFSWKIHESYCNAVCSELPTVSNGKIVDNYSLPFLPNESVKYDCDAGYISESHDDKITCVVENGVAKWTTRYCKLKSCNDPGYTENARRIGNLFTFGHNVTYFCNEGYKINGIATKFCSSTGQWIPNAVPTCEDHGKVILSSERRFNSIATYKCERFFNLTGSPERICQEDGTWSGFAPKCTEIVCVDPRKLANIHVLPDKDVFYAGELVIFRCKSDNTHKSSKCLETGEWSIHPPSCLDLEVREVPPTEQIMTTVPVKELIANTCDDPGTIKNGVKIILGLSVNSTVTYKCNDGYELRGKATLLCLEDGRWDLDKLPLCIKPITTATIAGIVIGVILFISVGVGIYFWYRWREKGIRGYGEKSKALTADATDLEEISGLERGKRPIPVTVL